jgi:16S rRNA processing protein RimM
MVPPWNDMAVVGRVARVHGLRGQVVVNPETDFPESRFAPGQVVYREHDGQPLAMRLTTMRLHRGRPIVGFEGIESIEQAELLAGVELRVPLAVLEALPPHVFYVHDLAGCRVETGAGTVIGTVERVDGYGGASQLAIATGDGEVLIPLAADICRTVDVVGKVIVIEPIEGLLDLNRSHRPKDRRSTG